MLKKFRIYIDRKGRSVLSGADIKRTADNFRGGFLPQQRIEGVGGAQAADDIYPKGYQTYHDKDEHSLEEFAVGADFHELP